MGENMPLAEEYAVMLGQMAENPTPAMSDMAPAEAREMYRMMRPVIEELPIGSVRDEQIAGPAGDLALRIYTPTGDGPFGIFVNFHGGGWVIGDLDTSDSVCRSLAEAASCVVVSVDYRLAPENPAPAAIEDCWAALQWVSENQSSLGGNGLLAVGGESAGACLAATMSMHARDLETPNIDFQLLAYPVLDADLTRQSYIDNGDGYLLTTATMQWFWDQYCPDEELRSNPALSPLQAGDLKDLPATLVVTAEFDPLRDEGELYGQRLKEAGVAAEIMRCDGLVHDFLATAPVFPSSGAAFTQIAEKVRTALAK
jgi:acetyl esterase